MASRKRSSGRERARRRDAARAPSGTGRAIWSGTISFGLVAVPVDLFPVVRSSRTALRLLAPDGAPVQRRYVCARDGKDVPWDELVRGFELEDGSHVVLTDDELDAAAPEKSRDIDLRRFVPRGELDPFLFERAYVLTPSGDSSKPYRLLAEAMARTERAGIATFVMRSKEYLVAIVARDGLLWAETLRFADELRQPQDLGLDALPRPKAELQRAFEAAIEALAAESIDDEQLVDRREQRLRELLEQKRADAVDVVTAPAVDEDPEAASPPDMLAAIRASLARLSEAKASPARTSSRAPSNGSARRTGARTRSGRSTRAEPEAANEPSPQQLSKADLYAEAQALDVPGRSKMSKSALARAVGAARKHAG